MRAAPIILLAAWFAGPACGRDVATSPSSAPANAEFSAVPATADWPASTPEAENLDRTRLADLVQRIRRGD